MSALRKQAGDAVAHEIADRRTDVAEMPEAFGYDDDVTPEGIEQVRERARAQMDGKKWKVIDGYNGSEPTDLDR